MAHYDRNFEHFDVNSLVLNGSIIGKSSHNNGWFGDEWKCKKVFQFPPIAAGNRKGLRSYLYSALLFIKKKGYSDGFKVDWLIQSSVFSLVKLY